MRGWITTHRRQAGERTELAACVLRPIAVHVEDFVQLATEI